MPQRNKIHEVVEIYHHLPRWDRLLLRWYIRWRMWQDTRARAYHWIGRAARNFGLYFPERKKIVIYVFGWRIILWLSLNRETHPRF